MLKIAVDGFTASGKGALSRAIAAKYDLAYLESGALYRAAAWYRRKHSLEGIEDSKLADKLSGVDFSIIIKDHYSDLHTEEIGALASEIAQILEVRRVINIFQKQFIAENSRPGSKGLIIEGRDIGTTIMPDADLKFFITADLTVRAQRRYKQLSFGEVSDGNKLSSLEEVTSYIEGRDYKDQNREHSPLYPAPGAYVIDNSTSFEITFDELCHLLEEHQQQAHEQ